MLSVRCLLTLGASRSVAVVTARHPMGNAQIAEKRATSAFSSLFPHPRPLHLSLCRLCPAVYPPEHLCSALLDSRCRREEHHQGSLEGRLSHPLVARSSRILLRKITPCPRPLALTTLRLQKTEAESHSDGYTKKSTGSACPLRTSTVNLTREGALPHPLHPVAPRRSTSTHRRTGPRLLASAERVLTRPSLGSREVVSWRLAA